MGVFQGSGLCPQQQGGTEDDCNTTCFLENDGHYRCEQPKTGQDKSYDVVHDGEEDIEFDA